MPTIARNVFDVTEASGTVVSTMALAESAGYTSGEAALSANQAVGIVVGKSDTARVTLKELMGELIDACDQVAEIAPFQMMEEITV